MKEAKKYENVIRRFYRPEIYKCPECGKSLKRAVTISERTVVTLRGVIKLIHGGYRCLNQECGAKGRTYRSAAADALALPRMIFGLDIVILAGQLRLGEHQTLDEVHVQLSERLRPLGVSISRREIMNLFDDFSALLRAASDAKQDKEWMKEVEKNTGIIVSIDGIKPDGGNEKVYLVRDALTGRLLNAENVRESSVDRLKQVLAPVVSLGISVLGTISDAQESEIMALSQLWPDVPHQTCQFHALREASRAGFQEDSEMRAQMRKDLVPKVREVQKQIAAQVEQVSEAEAKQLKALDTYALGVQTALNRKGKLPFDYAGIEASEALDDVAASLEKLEKRGTIRESI
ncbi:MAG: transposase [Chloroflexi bacterium]|nr:MAG: transposase [Chloroflexota bacterium]